jgi:formylmethanofuran dehydrogenase subunit A
LGLGGKKGSLAVGADGDVAIYDFNPKTTDQTQKPELLVKALERAAYTVKGGEIVVKDGEVVSNGTTKSTYWTDADVFDNAEVKHDIVDKFLKYYSVTLNNYPVQESYLVNPTVLKANPLAGGN